MMTSSCEVAGAGRQACLYPRTQDEARRSTAWPAGPGPAAMLQGAARDRLHSRSSLRSLFFSSLSLLINLSPTVAVLNLWYIQGGTERPARSCAWPAVQEPLLHTYKKKKMQKESSGSRESGAMGANRMFVSNSFWGENPRGCLPGSRCWLFFASLWRFGLYNFIFLAHISLCISIYILAECSFFFPTQCSDTKCNSHWRPIT